MNAKRYLCAVDPQYNDSLSPASKTTLKHQGGPMSKEEVAEVEKDSLPLVLRMRATTTKLERNRTGSGFLEILRECSVEQSS